MPGLMKMPMVVGISFLWMRLSKTKAALLGPANLGSSGLALPPSWKIMTAVGFEASYWAGM